MFFPQRLIALAATGAALCLAAPTSALAYREGALDCRVGTGVGFVITSTRALNCVFRSNRGGAPERYVGTIRRFGLDLGFTGPGRLAWAVFAETRPGFGALEGVYGGGSGAISLGVGVGANALVGGANNQFTLQPLSVEAQTGINIAAGVGAMQLEYVPERGRRRAPPRRHRLPR
jgi:hypothetical protein